MFGRNTPDDPEGFDAATEFQQAVDLAAQPMSRLSWPVSGRT